MNLQFYTLGLLLCAMFSSVCTASYKYKYFPPVLKATAWYAVVEFIAQSAVTSVFWYQKQHNFSLFHISFVLEAITLLLVYREIFKKYIEEKNVYVHRKIFIVLIVAFVVFAIANAIWWQPNIYPSCTRIILSVMIIVLNVLYIYKHTTYEPIPRSALELVNYQRSRVSLFWITTGLLLFHSFSLMRYGFINRFREELSKESYKTISMIQVLVVVILFVFITIGFIKAKRIIVINDGKIDDKSSK